MNKLLYKKNRNNKILTWAIWINKKGNSGFPEVWIEHGLSDGKKQNTFDIIDKGVNVGKANETTPLEQANLVAERKITKQIEEGYKESIEEALQDQTIGFDEPLPKEFCFYKPKNSIDAKKIEKLEKAGRLIITEKEDGQMYIVRKSKKFGVEIYSRRMELETEKFPHLIPLFNKLPWGVILLGEMILTGYNSHIVAYHNVGRICRSDPDEAIRKQVRWGKTSYRIFDVAFYDHINYLSTFGYAIRHNMACDLAAMCESDFVKPVKILNMSHRDAMEYVIENKIEGLVLWDSKDPMNDSDWGTFNGKAYRPNVLWKSKPKKEDDFIVRFDPENDIGEYGKGKNKGKCGSVFIYQIEDGVEINLGKCGGGLKDDQRDFYSDKKLFPRVWRIEYDSIQPETGALRYPVFNADRTFIGDKSIEECVMSEDIKEARKASSDE